MKLPLAAATVLASTIPSVYAKRNGLFENDETNGVGAPSKPDHANNAGSPPVDKGQALTAGNVTSSGAVGSGRPKFVVEQVPNKVPSKENLHGPTQGGGPPANTPAQVDMTARADGMTTGNMEGIPSRHGEIAVSELGMDFSKVPVLVFKGLGDDDKSSKPLIIKRVDVNVPLPKIWKPEGSKLVGEVAQVWYGEEVGSKGTASCMFMANSDGGLVGSVQDGTNTYDILTDYEEDKDSNGKQSWKSKIKYSVVKLADLPKEEDDALEGESSGPERRLLHYNRRRLGVDASKVIEKTRKLQEDCDDLEGEYGPWYDSDGPYFDCDWYSQKDYCSEYGNDYSNFGFTANQACCACGGGGVLIDLLIVYSTGTQTSMLNKANSCILQTNLALSMSGSIAKFRLVGLKKDSSYNDNDKSVRKILDDLTNTNDGQLDRVHGWRNTYGADLVHYLSDGIAGDKYSGVAWGLGSGCRHKGWFNTCWDGLFGNKGWEELGFGVSDQYYSALNGAYTFAHEIGHNMGCDHDSANDDTPKGYNHGFYDGATCTRTLMSYSNGCYIGRILQYSNIVRKYNGITVGDSTTSNCARTITENAKRTKNFRAAKVLRTVELCMNVDCEGESYRAAHTIGDWPEMPEDMVVNDLAPLKAIIPRGLSFEYFEQNNFEGRNEAFGSKYGDRIVNLNDFGVASFKVRQIPSGSVKICRYRDCSGGYVYYGSVATWNSMPSFIGDDMLSYLHIPQGFKVELFEDENLEGLVWSGGSVYTDLTLTSLFDSGVGISSFTIRVL